jgi:sugar-specific transcriptional regulator TrmB
MVVKKIILDKLKDTANLNTYEAKVYTSLLSRGISSAGELADISGVPRSRCYDVLESLEKKGFVFMKIGKPIKYLAIPPEEALETIKKQTRIEENRLLSLYDDLKETETFNELKQLYSTGVNYIDSSDISHSVVGKQNINALMKEMLSRASGNIAIHTDEEGVKRKLKLLKRTVNKKVDITLHAPVDRIKNKNITLNKSEKDIRMINVDNKELLFFTSPPEVDPDHESAVWIKSKFIANALKDLI